MEQSYISQIYVDENYWEELGRDVDDGDGDEDDAWSALETNWGAGAVGEGCHPHPRTPKPSDGGRKI